MMKSGTIAILSVGLTMSSGCGFYAVYVTQKMDNAFSEYHSQASYLKLEDTREQVLGRLTPTVFQQYVVKTGEL